MFDPDSCIQLLASAATTTPAPPAAGGGMSGLTILLIVVGFIVLMGFWLVAMYNALVSMRNRVKESWAQIEVQLKRRYDLIPNLVETVKGYASHEEDTLTKVVEARNHALGALQALTGGKGMASGMPVASGGASSSMPSPMGGGGGAAAGGGGGFGALMEAEGMLMSAMKGMTLTFERYPDLKANQNFMQLQEELTATENKIAFARQHYNDEVRIYNTKRESIPSNFVAAMGGFKEAAFFEISEAERKNVKVDFS